MLEKLFNPKTIALVGASNKKGKVGNTIMKNLLFGTTLREIYPINLHENKILGKKAYCKISDIPISELDLAIIAVPKEFVFDVLKDAGKKKTKFAIIISAGFKEAGDLESEEKIKQIAKKNKIRIVGPNTLGIIDNFSKLDCLFLPKTAEPRPKKGTISIISQSGTVGAVACAKFAEGSVGINKFVSYGNASDLNECDFIEYLNKDKNTKVICAYIEEIQDGKRFIELMKKQKKPIIMLKGGKTKAGMQSVQSHTGNLAGDFNVYKGIMKQFGIINADTINDLVNFSKSALLKKVKNCTIITNGGGYGILLVDYLEKYKIPITQLSEKIKFQLAKELPVGVSIKNPIDLLGDSDPERFYKAIKITENETDTYIIVILGQTPEISKVAIEKILEKITPIKKNFVFLSTLLKYTKDIAHHKFIVFENPEDVAKSLSIICNTIKV